MGQSESLQDADAILCDLRQNVEKLFDDVGDLPLANTVKIEQFEALSQLFDAIKEQIDHLEALNNPLPKGQCLLEDVETDNFNPTKSIYCDICHGSYTRNHRSHHFATYKHREAEAHKLGYFNVTRKTLKMGEKPAN